MRSLMGGATAIFALAACSSVQGQVHSAGDHAESETLAQAAARYDLGRPYLGGPLPGGEQLIRPQPQGEDPRLLNDLVANEEALAIRDSPRWELAARDADLGSGWYHRAFAGAAGRPLDADSAPAIANVLRRSATDFGMSTGAVKEQYQRRRPFMINDKPSCTPHDEAILEDNGSYPSGHSAIGYGTSLVLASIFPERAAQLLQRGRDFGDSRWICNVHWKSDVEEGRSFAAATYARLQTDAGFLADLAVARAEVQSATQTEEADD
ncbi:acid phosphatase [Altererythrobacter sp. MF3-039]|uniref:acid phosphatase n=1 Tax=Altererythrobacter sp. MF3-039 TaxID=3252901 RepID=UPI00390C643D